MAAKAKFTIARALPLIFVVAGAIGLLASFALTHDKIKVLADPLYDPACNINPIFSCGSVMSTEQASLLGMPNTVFGIAAFAALATLGVVLMTGAKLSRRMWQLVQLAATGGFVFMHYLFFQAVYRINALCPWCFAVWMITIPVFWYITIFNLQAGNIKLPGRLAKLTPFIIKNHGNILAAWYLVLFIIIIEHFWYYWSTLL